MRLEPGFEPVPPGLLHHFATFPRQKKRKKSGGQEQENLLSKAQFCFKGNVGQISERRGGAHMGFSELIDTILN